MESAHLSERQKLIKAQQAQSRREKNGKAVVGSGRLLL